MLDESTPVIVAGTGHLTDYGGPYVGVFFITCLNFYRLTVIVSFSDVFGLLQTILANDNLVK